MRYLGLDLGTRTLGISLSDVTHTIATTYKTIHFEEKKYDVLIPEIEKIIKEFNISKIILGLPKNMNNSLGDRALETIAFKEELEKSLKVEVLLQDERLTTVEANNYMLKADMSRMKRKEKIDSLAANIILQSYLDKERK